MMAHIGGISATKLFPGGFRLLIMFLGDLLQEDSVDMYVQQAQRALWASVHLYVHGSASHAVATNEHTYSALLSSTRTSLGIGHCICTHQEKGYTVVNKGLHSCQRHTFALSICRLEYVEFFNCPMRLQHSQKILISESLRDHANEHLSLLCETQQQLVS